MPVLDLQQAISLLEKGNAEEAATLLEEMVAEMPAYATARVLLARSYEALGRWGQALAVWRDALHLIPNSPVIQRGLERAASRSASRSALDKAPARVEEPRTEEPPRIHEPRTGEPPFQERAYSEEPPPIEELPPLREPEDELPPLREPEDELPRYDIPGLHEGEAAYDLKEPEDEPYPEPELPKRFTYVDPGSVPEPFEAAEHADHFHVPESEEHWTHLSSEEEKRDEEPQFEDLDRLITELESARIVPRPDMESLPSPDLEDDIEDVVSETLARIYASQDQYDEAARVYELLAGQQPEKSAEFMKKASEMRARASDES